MWPNRFQNIKLKHLLKDWLESGWFAAGILMAVTLFLAFLNYQPGTWLSGWDNLHPEFNFGLNIRRSLYAVWQEYQGVGLLGGMSHAADLPHQVLLWLVSLILSPQLLRYGYTFTTLLLGPLGMFWLVRQVLARRFKPVFREFASLSGGLYYLLNLGTVQIFFVPYESFITQYAALPWLVYLMIHFLEKDRPRIWPLILTLVLAAPMAYVGTVFLVSLVVLGVVALEYLWTFRSTGALRKVGKVFALIGVVNAFWLLPFLYFVITQGSIVKTSRVNEYSTPDMILRSLEFTNPKDIMLLRGFWFNYVDRAESGKFDYLLGSWRGHLENPIIAILGYGIFALVALGLPVAFSYKIPWRKSALALFGLSWFMLLAENQPLGFVFTWFSANIPLFAEMFRSVFTKWSPVAMLSFAIFFSFGSLVVLQAFRGLLGFVSQRLSVCVAGIAMIGVFLAFLSPAFQGHLIDSAVRSNLPNEYFELMDWFKDQDPSTRIANFPQHTFWGWNYYDWGYRGSGFIWYGIEQPILDRAFDVWSHQNETYYKEVSQAVYSQDLPLFETLLDKYQINWILVDRSVSVAGEQTLLFIPQLEEMIQKSEKVKLAKDFGGKLAVYKTALSYDVKNYVYAPTSIKRIEPKAVGVSQEDRVYETEGPSFSTNGQTDNITVSSFYPFRDIDTSYLVSAEDLDGQVILFGKGWKLSDNQDEMVLLEVPNPALTDAVVPVRVLANTVGNKLSVRFVYLFPKLFIDGSLIPNETTSTKIEIPLASTQGPFTISINGKQFLTLTNTSGKEQEIGTSVLWTKKDNTISAYTQATGTTLDISDRLFKEPINRCSDELENQTFTKQVSGNQLRLKGKRVVACVFTKIDNLLGVGRALIQTRFDYRSKAQARPIYLLIDGKTGEPFNQAYTANSRYASEWRSFEELTEANLSDPTELWVQLLLDAFESEAETEIEYKDVVLTEYPFVGTALIKPRFIKDDLARIETVPVPARVDSVQLVVPKVESWATAVETPLDARNYPQARNCDNFHNTWFTREVSQGGISPVLTYASRDAGSCDFWEFRNLPQDISYLVSFEHRFISGKPFQVCINNSISKHCDQEFKLRQVEGWQRTTVPLPAMLTAERGYTLHLDNQAIGNVESRNELRKIEIYPADLGWIETLRIKPKLAGNIDNQLTVKNTWHPNPSLFLVSLKSDGEGLLVLNQAYNQGWQAFEVGQTIIKSKDIFRYLFLLPSLFKPVGQHVTVNTWANGWRIIQTEGNHTPQERILALVYVPQYLEFAGFALWLIACLYWIKTVRSEPRTLLVRLSQKLKPRPKLSQRLRDYLPWKKRASLERTLSDIRQREASFLKNKWTAIREELQALVRRDR